MAEAFERFKRFEYRQNSNLVLQRDPYLTGAPGGAHQGEPTGEPETLAGRKLFPMGDKAERGLKKEEKEKIGKRRAKQKEGGLTKRTKLVRGGERKRVMWLNDMLWTGACGFVVSASFLYILPRPRVLAAMPCWG